METITIKKPKTIEQQILSLEVGQQAYISNKDCKRESVRSIVARMNIKYDSQFKSDGKGLIDGIYVIRTK